MDGGANNSPVWFAMPPDFEASQALGAIERQKVMPGDYENRDRIGPFRQLGIRELLEREVKTTEIRLQNLRLLLADLPAAPSPAFDEALRAFFKP